MKYFHGTTDFYMEGPSAITLGKFDGVHRGHQKLIRHIRQWENAAVSSVVFALKVKKEELLLTEEEQKDIIEELGVTCLIECPFLPEISGMEPETFVKEILVERLHAEYITVGKDFHFGYQKKGDVKLLQQLQHKYGFQADVLEKEQYKGRDISSTYIRECLLDADMRTAKELLGRPYTVSGEVLHGRKIGRTLGMPTVNLVPPREKLLPPNGVYATRTWIDGNSYPGITNIGYKPTVGEKFKGVETYLFDLDQDLYGKYIVTEFYQFERPEQKFSSLEALKHQMHQDISFGKEYFSE